MSTHAHIYQGTPPMVISAFIQRPLTKKVHHKAHDLVNRASRGPNKDKLEIEIQFLNGYKTVSSYVFTNGKSYLLRSWPEAYYQQKDAGRTTTYASKCSFWSQPY